MPQGKGTYGSQVGRPKKKKRPYDEEDDLTKEKVMQNEPSGLGKTLLTSKPTKEDTSDEKQRKGSFYKSVY